MTTDLDALRVIAFPGAPNLPVFVGIAEGFFTNAGVSVSLDITTSSVDQATKTAAGEYDIVMSAFDNVVAYAEGQGAAGADVHPDYVALMGATQLELSLVVASDIETFDDLKGRTLALDAKDTGFAFVLTDMLQQAGLGPEDTEYVPVGATLQRWQAIQAGDHVGTLTIEPFTTLATRAGFKVLQKSTDLYDAYQGGVIIAPRSFLAANPDAVQGYIAGYLEALDWVLDPANREAAATCLQANIPAIKPQAVEPVMNSLLNPKSGLTPDGAILPDGMARVLDLRNRHGSGDNELTDFNRYLDLSHYEAVVRQRRGA